MFTNLLAHESGKLVVNSMSWASGNDASLDRFPYECHVSDDVQKFVTSTFVLPHQRFVLNVANLGGIHVGNFQYVCKLIQLVLRHFTLVNNDSVVHVSAFNEIGFQQRNNVANEDKGTGRSYFVPIVFDVV